MTAPDVTAPPRLEFDVPCFPGPGIRSVHQPHRPVAAAGPLRAPARLIYRWHLCSDPADATEVEVQFLASAPGSTRVRLEHRAWDALEDGAVRRDRNQAGWQQVLQPYTAACHS